MSFAETVRSRFRFDKESPWHFYRMVFIYSLIVSACITIPFIIYELFKTGSAVFLYYGDYNAQQIPFYRHVVGAVHEGSFGWDWYTDLGSNFIGSYSYYMLGSPFFWLMACFPASWVPYLMAPMYMVKYIVAALLAYCYLQRFVKNKNYAVIGALLYSFCGFQIYNTFFNQFHDVVAFFPLLLIGMEEFVQNDRRGLFAIAVTVNALINYFMFAGQVVFCIVYFMFRVSDKKFRITIKKFLWLAAEAVMGFLMSMFIFLPAALALSGNGRVGRTYTGNIAELFENLFKGVKGWFTGDETDYFAKVKQELGTLFTWKHSGSLYWQRYGQIFESYFFPPDIPSRVNFFYGHETRWASISMYLPMFSMSGVFALFTVKGRRWLKKIVIFLILCSFFPLLNSIFFLFNSSYYARWLYMMVLMFALGTCVSLEDMRTRWKGPVAVCTAVCTAVAVPLGLFWYYSEDSKKYTLGYPPFMGRFVLYVGIALLGLALTAWLIRRKRGTKGFTNSVIICVCVMTVLYGCVHIINGKQHSHDSNFLVNDCIEAEINLPDPQKEFYRIDQYRDSSISTIDNLGLYWHYPSMECFHTVVPPSIMEFYPKVKVERNVGSRADSSLYGLRAFLSVKYSFIRQTSNKRTEVSSKDPDTGETVMTGEYTQKHKAKGFSYLETQNHFDIYINDNWLPMGFAYDEFMTQSDFESAYSESERHLALCSYLVVPDDKADFYSQFMTRVLGPHGEYSESEGKSVTVKNYLPANEAGFKQSVAARREMSCDSFDYSSSGFTAHIELDKAATVFFSVPYEEYGWSAKVNGEEAEVLKVFYGFVAVKCESGESEIEFAYTTPGLLVGGKLAFGDTEVTVPMSGLVLTLAGLVLFVLYMLYFKFAKREKCEYGLVKNSYYDDMGAFDPPAEKKRRKRGKKAKDEAPAEPAVTEIKAVEPNRGTDETETEEAEGSAPEEDEETETDGDSDEMIPAEESEEERNEE